MLSEVFLTLTMSVSKTFLKISCTYLFESVELKSKLKETVWFDTTS